MRLTAKEWAARHGLADRTVRAKLQRGTLRGTKERDPVTGVEVWYIDEPDAPEDWSTGGPEYPEDENSARPAHPEYRRDLDIGDLIALVRERDQLVREKDQTILELAGRLGFYQSEIQHLQGENTQLKERIALLEAPKPDSVDPVDQAKSEAGNRSAPEQNGLDSAVQKGHRRPWWHFLAFW